MKNRQLTLDIYMNKVFKAIMLFIPLIALCAGITFTAFKIAGFYADVSLTALIIFDCTNIIYCIIGLLFSKHCEDEEKNLKPKIVYVGKIVISLVIIIQWNFISYMIPSRDFWAYFSLFIIVSVLFLDSKYVIHTIGIVLISMFISWIVKPDILLPVRNEYFVPELILRCIVVAFVCVLMFLITFIVEKLVVKELENIAEYDSLTLLRNRRSLSMKMDEAIANFNNNDKRFCFLMCDIDDFKIVNDTYGHPFGDIVLKNIGRIFILNLGNDCSLFRYGGEEICAIMDMGLEEAIKEAEYVRKEIENAVHSSDNIKIKVTMSMGIMEYKKGMTKADIVKVADSNLYYAKSHGKNKVIS